MHASPQEAGTTTGNNTGNNTGTRTGINVGINISVVRGRMTRPPQERLLVDGRSSWTFDLRVGPNGHLPAGTVPVVWEPPQPASPCPVTVGDEVVVLGSVRQRFFRVGAATQSRTEVLATTVLPATRRAGVRKALVQLVDAVS